MQIVAAIDARRGLAIGAAAAVAIAMAIAQLILVEELPLAGEHAGRRRRSTVSKGMIEVSNRHSPVEERIEQTGDLTAVRGCILLLQQRQYLLCAKAQNVWQQCQRSATRLLDNQLEHLQHLLHDSQAAQRQLFPGEGIVVY